MEVPMVPSVMHCVLGVCSIAFSQCLLPNALGVLSNVIVLRTVNLCGVVIGQCCNALLFVCLVTEVRARQKARVLSTYLLSPRFPCAHLLGVSLCYALSGGVVVQCHLACICRRFSGFLRSHTSGLVVVPTCVVGVIDSSTLCHGWFRSQRSSTNARVLDCLVAVLVYFNDVLPTVCMGVRSICRRFSGFLRSHTSGLVVVPTCVVGVIDSSTLCHGWFRSQRSSTCARVLDSLAAVLIDFNDVLPTVCMGIGSICGQDWYSVARLIHSIRLDALCLL